MDKKIASLCLLAYKRPELLEQTLKSLHETKAGFPYELIVHDDGGDGEVSTILSKYLRERKITTLIKNGGDNKGIKTALQRCVMCSEGYYLIKLDADLTFTSGWLSRAIDVLEKKDVGAVGLLDYRKYDPNDYRFWDVWEDNGFTGCADFVSSAYGFTRSTFMSYGNAMEHDGWHLYLRDMRLKLGLLDVVNNHGFGEKSIYVGKDGKAVEMDHPSIIFE